MKTPQRYLVTATVVLANLFLAIVGLHAQDYGQSAPSATGLSCDGKGSAPHNVETYTPMFSWQFVDADTGDGQTAYGIQVGTSAGGHDMWDLTMQSSSTSIRMYAGSELLPNTTYYWSVQVWDRANQPSGIAQASFMVLDIGLRVFDGTSVIRIAADDNSEANKLRIRKGTTTYGIPLVNPSEHGASKIRVQTASGTKALKMMVAPPPAIGLALGNMGFGAILSGGSPVEQTAAVSNVGGGTLSGLAAGVTYEIGSGWLSASLDGATAPAVLTVTASLATLNAGTYTATVTVASGAASNGSQNVHVAFTVAPPPAIEYAIPTANANPWKLAVAMDGTLWFTEMNAPEIGKLAGGVVTEYGLSYEPFPMSATGIACNFSNGLVYFTEGPYEDGHYGTLDPATGTLNEYPSGLPAATGDGVVDQNGYFWFAGWDSRRVVKVAGQAITDTFLLPMFGYSSGPFSVDSGGNLWMCMVSAYEYFPRLIRVTPAGESTVFYLPQQQMTLRYPIAAGGKVWYVLSVFNGSYTWQSSIGCYDPATAQFSTFQTPTANSGIAQLADDAQGRIWFTETNVDRIGVLDPSSGIITEFPVAPNSRPVGIAIDKARNLLWFSENGLNKIGRMSIGG